MSKNDQETPAVFSENTEALKATEADEMPEPEINSSFQMGMQILNALAFVGCMVLSSQATKIAGKSFGSVAPDIRIQVANYAAGVIWPIIYLLLATFSVYQALPNKCVPTRNNHLIFGQIRFLFAANLFSNGLWLILFLQGTPTFLGLAALNLFFMTFSQLYILKKCCQVEVNRVEFICLRVGFTLYTAWVTAANILGIGFYLSSIGFKNPNAGLDEVTWAIIILYVAQVVYIAAAYFERNPLFCGLYIYVLIAIMIKQSDYSSIVINCWICLVLTIAAVTGISFVCHKEWKNGTAKKGLFYKMK